MSTCQISPSLPSLPGTAQADAAALRDFLTRHVAPHIHLMNDGGAGLPGRYFGDDVEGAVSWAVEMNRAGHNCYFTPNVVREGQSSKPSKPDIVAARFAHVDVDPPKDGAPWNPVETIERAKQEGASLVIDSGRGVWAYFTLDAPTSDQTAIEAVNTGIRDHYRAAGLGSPDAAQNIDRAARLPYTVNWKTGKLARVVHEVDTRHTLGALQQKFKAVSLPVAREVPDDLPPHPVYASWTDEQIASDICRDPALAALWNGDATAYPDRSDADFRLANEILERARKFERSCALFRESGLAPLKRPADANKKPDSQVEKTMRSAVKKRAEELSKMFIHAPIGTLPVGAQIIPFPTQPAAAPVLPQLVAASSFAGKLVPERQWIVESLVPQGYVTDLTADGGTGKSLLALQLAVARASGKKWLGLPTQPGATIYLAAEDDVDELHRRLADICRETGTSLDALDNFHILPLFGEDARLAGLTGKEFQATALYNHLHGLIASVQAGLIIIDTRADTFGGDEVNRAQVMQFVSLLKKMANDHDATVLLISHPSRAGQALGDGQSGSTAWGNAVRSRIYLTREADNTLTLATKKANYGPNDTQIKLEWRNGCFVSLGNMADPFTRIEIQAPVDKEFFDLLVESVRNGTGAGPSPSSPYYAPKMFAKSLGVPTKKKPFEEAMHRLLRAGRIKIGQSDGYASKRRDILVPVY